MGKLLMCFLVVTLAFLVLAVPIATAKPFFEEKSTVSDLAELDALLSGDHGDANGSREIYQLYGGQVRPIQPSIQQARCTMFPIRITSTTSPSLDISWDCSRTEI